MYKIIPWMRDLDLKDFYSQAKVRGFENNSSRDKMINCFLNEDDWQVWILYYNNIAVGSCAAHTIPEGYRICARTCIFTDMLDPTYSKSLRTKSVITEHQNPTAQFFIPACIKWVAGRGDIFITSHPSNVGTQRRVHRTWGPLLAKTGVVVDSFSKEYRGHLQTFWKLNSELFLDQLSKVRQWQ
jgi:hypothetical protein